MTTRIEAVLATTADDLLRYFRRRVGDVDAADLVAETILVALRRQRVVPDDDQRARMWLFGVAHNVLLHHDRGVRRRLRLADRARALLATTEHSASADAGLEVRDAIARLEPDLAELVRLVHWEGFTLAQAAEVMQVPASTLRNHYQRAKQELRIALVDRRNASDTSEAANSGRAAVTGAQATDSHRA